MANKATEELTTITELDPTNDFLLVKEAGQAQLRKIAPKDCYFGHMEPVVCILRLTGGSPNTIEILNEGLLGEHKKLNVASVSMDSTKISLVFSKTFAYVGAVVVNGDDVCAGSRLFGQEVTVSGMDIHVRNAAGAVINPLTDSGAGSLVDTNNAIWVLGMMWI